MLTVLSEQHETARQSLPPEVYDYYAGGSGTETTLHEATEAWAACRLRPHVLRDVAAVDVRTELLGLPLRTPVGVAPTAFQALAHPDGERATTRAAAAAGALTVVSTRASVPIEEVAAAGAGHPWWFQVYVMQERELTAALVRRAAAAGAAALVLTGDTPYVGVRRQLDRLRVGLSPEHFLVNLARHLPAGADPVVATEQDPSVGIEAIAWLADLSGLPVLVKGVLRGDDARRCLDAGAAGVVVSNHGGRQLDRAVAAAAALPEVVAAVRGRAPVLVDGGIRSGVDVAVALALGADAVLLGRPVLWALAAGGADGVGDLLAALTGDLARTMALLGAADLAALHADMVVQPGRRGRP